MSVEEKYFKGDVLRFIMHLITLGNIPVQYVTACLTTVDRVFGIPKNVEIYVLERVSDCSTLIERLPKEVQQQFKKICAVDKTSFSFYGKGRKIVVIFLDGMAPFLTRHKDAFIGLLLHELMHITLMEKHVDTSITRAFKRSFVQQTQHLSRERKNMLFSIGEVGVLLLKDLYANTELIQQGYDAYLLAYYDALFLQKKYCPLPLFYKQMNRANLRLIIEAVKFELLLLSIVLPLAKYRSQQAKRLLEQIKRCYQLKIKEVTLQYYDVEQVYQQHYSFTSTFQQLFFTCLFERTKALLALKK